MFDLKRKAERIMLTDIKITITARNGFIPGEVQAVIADMIRDYLVEQGVLVGPEPQQIDLFNH